MSEVLEILKFIFSDFWIWLGSAILLSIIFGNLRSFSVIKFYKKITKKD